jgi:hypothetical protein
MFSSAIGSTNSSRSACHVALRGGCGKAVVRIHDIDKYSQLDDGDEK